MNANCLKTGIEGIGGKRTEVRCGTVREVRKRKR
jgi:hypothetical protein